MTLTCKFNGCNRLTLPPFNGYCSRSHKKLDKRKPAKVILFCANCDTPVVRNPSEISKGGKAYCERCGKNSGESHPNWKDGQYINAGGYRCILHKKRYILEHRHTWEQANSSCILPGPTGTVAVHHINMNKLDNRPENLVLLSSEEHGRIHRIMDVGRFDEASEKLINRAGEQSFYIMHPEYLKNMHGENLWTFNSRKSQGRKV